MAIKGDGAWAAAVAPILHWIRVAWRTDQQLQGEVTRADLQEAWAESVDQRCSLFAADGTRKWSQSRGPIGSMALSLDRIG